MGVDPGSQFVGHPLSIAGEVGGANASRSMQVAGLGDSLKHVIMFPFQIKIIEFS
jgi:hypothetical protein